MQARHVRRTTLRWTGIRGARRDQRVRQDLQGPAFPFRVIRSGSVFVAGGSRPIIATFQRQPNGRVVPMVWASEKSDVYIIGFQGSLAPTGDRTLSFFLEKTATLGEMNLRCNNGDEDVQVDGPSSAWSNNQGAGFGASAR